MSKPDSGNPLAFLWLLKMEEEIAKLKPHAQKRIRAIYEASRPTMTIEDAVTRALTAIEDSDRQAVPE